MPSKKQRILCVDDENDILLILRTALKDDYDVTTASNGPDALMAVDEDKPDLVILDYMMPDMDGLEVLEEIRRQPHSANLPVIFLTGISDRTKIRQALDRGTSFYLVKPFEYADLMNKVALALKERTPAT